MRTRRIETGSSEATFASQKTPVAPRVLPRRLKSQVSSVRKIPETTPPVVGELDGSRVRELRSQVPVDRW